jgi:hypothetical protein
MLSLVVFLVTLGILGAFTLKAPSHTAISYLMRSHHDHTRSRLLYSQTDPAPVKDVPLPVPAVPVPGKEPPSPPYLQLNDRGYRVGEKPDGGVQLAGKNFFKEVRIPGLYVYM